jgi:prepilin-type N-terminal cleavage/methylation domain-containing protein
MVSRSGFALVEVIVASVLLSVALLAVAGTGLTAARIMRDAEAREEAVNRAATLLDSVMLNNLSGAGTVVTARYRLDWTGGASEASVNARLTDGQTFELRAPR